MIAHYLIDLLGLSLAYAASEDEDERYFTLVAATMYAERIIELSDRTNCHVWH